MLNEANQIADIFLLIFLLFEDLKLKTALGGYQERFCLCVGQVSSLLPSGACLSSSWVRSTAYPVHQGSIPAGIAITVFEEIILWYGVVSLKMAASFLGGHRW